MWTAFRCRQFFVELLPAPDAEFSRRPGETNIYLPVNQLPVDIRPSFLYLLRTMSIVSLTRDLLLSLILHCSVWNIITALNACLLYTSDAADE